MKSSKEIYDLFRGHKSGKKSVLEIPSKGKSFTHDEIVSEIEIISKNLEVLKPKKGKVRALVFVPVEFHFHSLVFSLFKMEIIPIFMDPGMGKKNILKSIESIDFDYFITIGKGKLFYWFYRKKFPADARVITISSLLNPKSKLEKKKKPLFVDKANNENLAAILFTSGGTGTPKGVHYSPEMFLNQISILKNLFSLDESGTDYAGFPLFGLFTLTMGMKVVIPQINFAAPATCDPEKVILDIKKFHCSFLAGSPAIWEKVADYCLTNHLQLEEVKNLVMFGAPVKISLIEKLIKIIPLGNVYSPYGATESLPVAMINAKVILGRFKKKIEAGEGMVVGQPIDHVKLLIVKRYVDLTINEVSLSQLCDNEEVGYVFVSSSTTSQTYENKVANSETKLKFNGETYHYMGDLGKIDNDGFLWFCGRAKHVLGNAGKLDTLFPILIEYVTNKHPMVLRSALVKNNKDEISLVVQRRDERTYLGRKEKNLFIQEIRELLKQSNYNELVIPRIYLYNRFPVDGRHNIKIDRPYLGQIIQSKGRAIQ